MQFFKFGLSHPKSPIHPILRHQTKIHDQHLVTSPLLFMTSYSYLLTDALFMPIHDQLPYPSPLKHHSPRLDNDFDGKLTAILNKSITSVFCLHLSLMSVIENSCSKPSGFVNFQLALNLSPIMGDLVSFIDLASGQHWQTGGNIGWEWDDNRTVYSCLSLSI